MRHGVLDWRWRVTTLVHHVIGVVPWTPREVSFIDGSVVLVRHVRRRWSVGGMVRWSRWKMIGVG